MKNTREILEKYFDERGEIKSDVLEKCVDGIFEEVTGGLNYVRNKSQK